MLNDLDLDQRPYFQILHAMLREDGTDPEIERTNRVMDWVLRTRHTIDRVCDRTEMQQQSMKKPAESGARDHDLLCRRNY